MRHYNPAIIVCAARCKYIPRRLYPRPCHCAKTSLSGAFANDSKSGNTHIQCTIFCITRDSLSLLKHHFRNKYFIRIINPSPIKKTAMGCVIVPNYFFKIIVCDRCLHSNMSITKKGEYMHSTKIAIIGAGAVGATIAYTLILKMFLRILHSLILMKRDAKAKFLICKMHSHFVN